ncbi:MAG TPA: AtpZ/AtpI family protein [Acetobacteraceae bacterium]|nr:AtpZ/AtpI family protein [Acetobacteraceae bacterium]
MSPAAPSPEPSPGAPDASDSFAASLRIRAARHHKAQREGPPSFGRYLAQVGVLGWTIVIPGLLGMFLGRWLDRRFGTGIFWTAPLLLVGLAIGCWSAWRWMHRP